MLISDTSLTLQSGTGLPTATAITLVIDATDPVSGLPTPSLKEVVTGTLSGTTLSNLLRGLDSTTQQGHASGANVVMWITADLWNDWQTSYLTQHTQLGAHTGITTNTIATSGNATVGGTLGVTGNTTLSGTLAVTSNVTENGNPVWQYLNSATYTGGTVTSSGATPTLITGLSVLATVPTGATALKITIQLYNLYIQTGATLALLSVYSGATSGALTTQLGGTSSNAGASGSAFGVVAGELITIIKSPTAGALYYSAAFSASSSNAKTDTASGTPALILVECC